MLGDSEAEGLGGLEVDHEVEGGRLLHREVRRMSPVKELGYVTCRPPGHISEIHAIRHEATGLRVLSAHIHARQPVLEREGSDLGTAPGKEGAAQDVES